MTILTNLTRTMLSITMGENSVVTGNENLVTTFEGWSGGTSMRRETASRLMAHGDFSERGYKGGKILSVRGDREFATRREAAEFVMELECFLADGEVGSVRVNDLNLELTLNMNVELNSMEPPVWIGNNVEYGFELYAADPLKYADAVTVISTTDVNGFPDPVTVTNVGNAKADLMYRVRGTYPDGLIIRNTDTGQELEIAGAVAATGANSIYIDGRTGKVTANNVDIGSQLVRREWTALAGNSSATFDLIATNSSSIRTLEVTVISKWH